MTSRTLRTCAIAVFVVLSAASRASGQETFSGTVDPELTTPDSGGTPILCKRMARSDVPTAVPGELFECVASWYVRDGQLPISLRLIEPRRGGYPVLFVDANRDGVFSNAERFSFVKRRHRYARAEVRFTIPTPAGSAFPRFPAVLLIAKDSLEPPFVPVHAADERYLFQSFFLFATARVRIDAKTYFFRYSVSPNDSEVDLRGAIQAVDQGKLEEDYLSPLRSASREVPVFRLGSRYVSTESVDLHTRSVLIRSREWSAYRRLELRRRLAIPDFAFVDWDGQTRRLSEFRHRHVLLYFWDRNCVPCEEQLAKIRAAGARFGPDRLAIIGLTRYPTPAEALRTLILPSGPFDAHARPESVRLLVEQWFGISATATSILLDSDGRVVSLNQQEYGRHPLYGSAMLKTLASVLPK